MDSRLDRIKVLLSINDDTKDNVLAILLEQAIDTICIYLGVTDFPTELDFVAEQMVIVRYNRLGAEGITTEKIDVLSTTYSYNIDELAPYKKILDNYSLHYLDNGGNKYNGRFKML
jgi:hypothetical protein